MIRVSLSLLEFAVSLICLSTTWMFLKSAFLKRINNSRGELRAEAFLSLIKRNVAVISLGCADLWAILVIFALNALTLTDDAPEEKHCSEFSINDCQHYLQHLLIGLLFLAIVDRLVVLCTVWWITKEDIVSTVVGYYVPLTFFGMLYSFTFIASNEETVLTICYKQNHPMVMSDKPAAWNQFIILRFFFFALFFFLASATSHLFHSQLTRAAAEMIMSIDEDSKSEFSKDIGNILEISDATWIKKHLDKVTMTYLIPDDKNGRGWRKCILSRRTEMSVSPECESLRRFSFVDARPYLGLFVYLACIVRFYHYTETFFENSELKYFTSLIFTTMLTINNVARVPAAATIEGLEEHATYCRIYKKDIILDRCSR